MEKEEKVNRLLCVCACVVIVVMVSILLLSISPLTQLLRTVQNKGGENLKAGEELPKRWLHH